MSILDRQAVLLHRLRRAMRAYNTARITGEAYDSIVAKLRLRVGALENERLAA